MPHLMASSFPGGAGVDSKPLDHAKSEVSMI